MHAHFHLPDGVRDGFAARVDCYMELDAVELAYKRRLVDPAAYNLDVAYDRFIVGKRRKLLAAKESNVSYKYCQKQAGGFIHQVEIRLQY